jgi:signal transduction histidine kinase
MPERPVTSLWLRLALPLLVFVAAGSLVLVVWMHAAARRESRRSFATLAQMNAELIRNARLPPSERTADYLSRVLNMRVFFRHAAWDMSAPARDGMAFRKSTELVPSLEGPLADSRDLLGAVGPGWGIVRVGRDFEAIAVSVEKDVSLLLVRPAEPIWAFLVKGETLPLLGAFGLLSVALAWALARGVVRPLRQLAERLPQIESDPDATLPGTERTDEIGQLARAYLATRAQLAEERARREQAERLAILGRMATGLAHEIHNPLSAICMHAQLLESAPAGELSGTAADSLPVLLGETAKIEGLVQQWMFLARPQPPQTAPADLAEIVAGVVRTLAPQAAHAQVQIFNEVPAGLFAKVDARRMAQAMGNVAINAIQAMPRGGTLTLRGERGDGVRLIFQDTGRGFSPLALARHAELFFSEKEGGMGIGLSVAAEILKAHSGSLCVGNAPEGGAHVVLQLPNPSR